MVACARLIFNREFSPQEDQVDKALINWMRRSCIEKEDECKNGTIEATWADLPGDIADQTVKLQVRIMGLQKHRPHNYI